MAITGLAQLILYPEPTPGDLFIVAMVGLSMFMLTAGRSRQYPV